MYIKTTSADPLSCSFSSEVEYSDKINTYSEKIDHDTSLPFEELIEKLTVYCIENKECNIHVDIDFGVIERKRLISEINKKLK